MSALSITLRRCLRWAGCLLLVAGVAQAQTAPSDTPAQAPAAAGDQISTIQVSSQLVLVPTAVRTKKGETIYGLTADKFVIEADGVRQQVRLDDSGTVQPLSLVVVVQCSRTAWRETGKLEGLSTMVDAMVGGAPAEVAVIQYGTGEELISKFQSDPERRAAALGHLQPCDDDNGVTTYDAVEYATQILEAHKAEGRRAILLVSETRDHGSQAKAEHVVEELGRTNVVLDALAFSPLRDETIDDDLKHGGTTSLLNPASLIYAVVQALRKNAPKELARLSGGEYLNFATGKTADRELLGLANHVHNEYLLSFVPRFPAPANAPSTATSVGAFAGLHDITVKVTDYPDAVLKHRGSFWVEAPK